MVHLRLITVLLLVALTSSGCATLILGQSQQVEVLTDPPGAFVTVDDKIFTTPARISLKRKDSHLITVEKDGYVPHSKLIKNDPSALVYLNVLFPFGFFVDEATGSAHSLNPDRICLKLKPRD